MIVGRRSFGIASETSPYLNKAGGQWTVDSINPINKLLHTESVDPAKDQSRSPPVYLPNSRAAQGDQPEATEPTCALHLHCPIRVLPHRQESATRFKTEESFIERSNPTQPSKRAYSPATRIKGSSDSNPRSASDNRLMLTCSIAASFTPFKASYSSLNRGGTVLPADIAGEVVKRRVRVVGTVSRRWAFRRAVSILALRLVRVESVRRQVEQEGQ